MPASSQNDEIFAKFAVELAAKILARHDARKHVLQSEAVKIYEETVAVAERTTNPVARARMLSRLSIEKTLQTLSSFASPQDMIDHREVTASEIEIIRAYFNDDDVLTAILSQER